jgi:hypothetical protein
MPVEQGATCCSCGHAIAGRRLGWQFAGHTFKAVEIHRHTFCAEHACNREAWAEFSGKRRATVASCMRSFMRGGSGLSGDTWQMVRSREWSVYGSILRRGSDGHRVSCTTSRAR